MLTNKISLFSGTMDVENRLASRDSSYPPSYNTQSYEIAWFSSKVGHRICHKPPWLIPFYFWNILGSPKSLTGKYEAAKYWTRLGNRRSRSTNFQMKKQKGMLTVSLERQPSCSSSRMHPSRTLMKNWVASGWHAVSKGSNRANLIRIYWPCDSVRLGTLIELNAGWSPGIRSLVIYPLLGLYPDVKFWTILYAEPQDLVSTQTTVSSSNISSGGVAKNHSKINKLFTRLQKYIVTSEDLLPGVVSLGMHHEQAIFEFLICMIWYDRAIRFSLSCEFIHHIHMYRIPDTSILNY